MTVLPPSLLSTLVFTAQLKTYEERGGDITNFDPNLTDVEVYDLGVDDGYIELARQILDTFGVSYAATN